MFTEKRKDKMRQSYQNLTRVELVEIVIKLRCKVNRRNQQLRVK